MLSRSIGDPAGAYCIKICSMIAVDWGTSSFRAYRLAADGAILERRSAELGILAVQDGQALPRPWRARCATGSMPARRRW